MELSCLGLSHKTAPLEVRERLVLADERLAQVVRAISEQGHEVMAVSTCNRVEFYVATGTSAAGIEVLRETLTGLGGPQTAPHLYERRGDDALLHLFRVAASLDSMVVGEPQILGQVKSALELAQRAGGARNELAKICSAAFYCAKRVRTETGIGRAAISMASAGVELAKKVFGGLNDKAALILGAGEMGELCARHLKSAGTAKLWVVNRTFERAEQLAREVGGEAKPFDALFALLPEVDLVISSTASLQPILTRDNMGPVLKAHRGSSLVLVDLAVPRDVAPDVNSLDGVYAYDVDDLQKVLSENAAARAAEAAKAEAIVAEEHARCVQARALREAVPVLAQLRARAEAIARAEAERTLQVLGPELGERQRRSVEAMAMAIVNKLLHLPTAKLRQVGTQEAPEHLAGAAAELFGLSREEALRVVDSKLGVNSEGGMDSDRGVDSKLAVDSENDAPAAPSEAVGGSKR
jgi:glutamyl-tRNA reductase